MLDVQTVYATPQDWLLAHDPDVPVHFFCPRALRDKLERFQTRFPGEVTFAVKSNPDVAVIETLLEGGMTAFDVASPAEIDLILSLSPKAELHYNNPVRSRAEIAHALDRGVRSFSVDEASELEKLIALAPKDTEVSVRFKCPVPGGAYKFDEKFGATPDIAAGLLARVAEAGLRPSLTFHVGTQCETASAWETYINEVPRIATAAGVWPTRVNVGGGFPAARTGDVPLETIFDTITAAAANWPVETPLICEPGRGLVAEAFALAARVKSTRAAAVYLNDGIYGSLSELPILGSTQVKVLGSTGPRTGEARPVVVYGPTCDSLDRLRDPLALPPVDEGDTLLFAAMGAYVSGVDTRFNGYGARHTVRVMSLTG